MKILFLTASFYPSIGGVETHVLKLTEELSKRGHEITVITEEKNKIWQFKRASANEAIKLKSIDNTTYYIHRKLHQTDVYYFKFGRTDFLKKFKIWYYLLWNYSLIKEADLVHCHDVFIWYFPFRFIFFKKKVFITFHGYEGEFPPVEKSVVIRKISEFLSRGNICIGDFITRWYKTKADYVLYGGVGKVKLKRIKFKKNKKIKILLIGRLSKDIGVQLYCETLKILKKQGVEFEFSVCGDGELKHKLEKYGKVLGFVRNTEKYIEEADFVFASSYLTMLSVMQIGKPIFAVYTNPLKHDYLYSSPFSKYIYIYSSGKKLAYGVKNYKNNLKRLLAAQKWANSQTWEKVTDVYEKLWKK